MKKKNKLLLFLVTSLAIIILALYTCYQYSLLETHRIEIKNHTIDLTIKMDETILDSQDDYTFIFRTKSKPEKEVKLQIDNCLSRCWILSENILNPHLIVLQGCADNYHVYLVDLTLAKTIKLNNVPDGFNTIDTLTNLYQDEQLPVNYHF